MRSLTYLVMGLALIYSIQPPRAHASGVREVAERGITFLEEEKYQLLDANDVPLTADAFLRNPPAEFSVVSSDNQESVRLRVKLAGKETHAYTVVASHAETGKTIARRRFSVGTGEKDVAAAKLRFQQTVRSMEEEIAKHFRQREGARNGRLFTRFAFLGLFGISSAHAAVMDMGVFGIVFVVTVTLALISLWSLANYIVGKSTIKNFRPTPGDKWFGIWSAAAAAFLTALTVAYCNDVFEPLLKNFRARR